MDSMSLMDASWCTLIIRPTVVSAHISSSDYPRLCVCVYVLAKMVMIDGVDIRGMSVAVIKKLLQGPPDSPVQITLILKEPSFGQDVDRILSVCVTVCVSVCLSVCLSLYLYLSCLCL